MPTWAELTTFVTTVLGNYTDGIVLGMILVAGTGGIAYLMRQGKK